MSILSTSIYDLVLINVCHFHLLLSVAQITAISRFSCLYLGSLHPRISYTVRCLILLVNLVLELLMRVGVQTDVETSEKYFPNNNLASIFRRLDRKTFEPGKFHDSTLSSWGSRHCLDFVSMFFRMQTIAEST